MAEKPVQVSQLDLAQLALFVGMAANERVLARLHDRGFAGLRTSHGFIVQHLLREPHSVGKLASLLGISQQAVSKSVAELVRLGYVEDAPSEDRRVRMLKLSRRGRAAVRAARTSRLELETELARLASEEAIDHTRRVLLLALDALGSTGTIRARRVRPHT